MQIKKNYFLKQFTTMRVGGPAKFFAVVKTEKDLLAALNFAKKSGLPWYVLGEGSNMIVSDKGYRGVIIQNQIKHFDLSGSSTTLSRPGEGKGRGRTVTVGAGHNLLKFIYKLNNRGLAGMERMAGIPGTVGGAIYGCAGAYGQDISDNLVSVRIWDGKRFRDLSHKETSFAYRSSIFKKRKNWIIIGASFALRKGKPTLLKKISRDIIKLRAIKYPPGMRCPGSFFKNIPVAGQKIPSELKSAVVYGKLPTAVLLDRVGAKGMSRGRIAVAAHHANLIYNPGGGRAADVKKLSTALKTLVKKRFGIIIDEEVQYL